MDGNGEAELVIDIFSHIYPKKFLKAYVKTQLPQLLRFVEAEYGAGDAYFIDEDARIKYMDKYGIEFEVLTIALPDVWQTIGEPIKLTRLANDSMAEAIEKHSQRLLGTATLPLLTGEALDELDRAIRDLGLKGVQIFSNMGGKPLDSPEFTSFYEKMSKYDLPIWIHPTHWEYYSWIQDYRLLQIFGWPFDTSLAMGRIVFGGILQKYPNLKFIIHHLGGMIPYFDERIRGFYDEALMHSHVYGGHLFPYDLKKDPIEYFKMMYADTVVNGSIPALKCGYSFYGSEHVVFATDYPFGPEKGERWTREILKSVKELDISEEHKRNIFEDNARKLLKI